MRFEKFTDAIGKQADQLEVKTLLADLGLPAHVRIKRGETDVYIDKSADGISLLFESEEYVSSKLDLNLVSDAPILTGVFLYGAGDDDYSPYKGELFGGLQFSDSRDSATTKLGKSKKFRVDFGTETWAINGQKMLFVRYFEGLKSIARIQIGIVLDANS
jgi:hypothetical protein